jgi:hypothetical protein
MTSNPFPYQHTHEGRLTHATRFNQQLSNDNDRLRQENQRLSNQLNKYIQTGQSLVQEAQKLHSDVELLKQALRIRDEQYQMCRDRVAGLQRHLEKTRKEASHWKAQVLELSRMGSDIRNRMSASVKPVPSRAQQAWPAVGDVVEVRNPSKKVPQHYYEVLAIGSPSYTRYTWADGASSPLKPNQYLVRAVNSKTKPDNELVDGEDWDLLYIGVEQSEASLTRNYISREPPLG